MYPSGQYYPGYPGAADQFSAAAAAATAAANAAMHSSYNQFAATPACEGSGPTLADRRGGCSDGAFGEPPQTPSMSELRRDARAFQPAGIAPPQQVAPLPGTRAGLPVLELMVALGQSPSAPTMPANTSDTMADSPSLPPASVTGADEWQRWRPISRIGGDSADGSSNSGSGAKAASGCVSSKGSQRGRFSQMGGSSAIVGPMDKTPRKLKRAQAAIGGESIDKTPAKWIQPLTVQRATTQLRQLLNFYFEPFSFQHNRYLLDLLARHIGAPEGSGPWLPEALRDFCFTLDELRGLGRIQAALLKQRQERWGERIGNLEYLHWDSSGGLKLINPPEVRRFAPAGTSLHPEVVSAASRYLAAMREQSGQAPARIVSVLSYALGESVVDQTSTGLQRRARLKRQLLFHHTDVMCLQGLDSKSAPENGEDGGVGLTACLVEEGYGYATANGDDGEANSIFWDVSRWELVGQEECDAGLRVDLRPFEDSTVLLRVICARPGVPTTTGPGLGKLFDGSEEGPLLVCADLTLLGGAEGASIVEELVGMPSVMREVTGEELLVPLASPVRDGQGAAPVRAGASGLNRLHCPDALLYRGMTPVVVLSSHTESYLATMLPEDVIAQFPALRLPIVAAFDWHGSEQRGTAG